MAYKRGNTTYGSTGVKTITVGFAPQGYRLTVRPPGAGYSAMQFSTGSTDGTVQTCNWGYVDNAHHDSGGSTSKVASLWQDVAGTLTEKVAITHNSFTATQFKINVNTADSNYDIDWEAWG